VRTLLEMTGHPGWELYMAALRAQYQGAVYELIHLDGDGRVQLTRQMACREMAKRLQFETSLGPRLTAALESEEKVIPFSRILAAQMED